LFGLGRELNNINYSLKLPRKEIMCRTGRAPSSWRRVVCPTTDDSTDAFYRSNIKIENNTPAHRALHEERSPLSPRTVSSKQGGGGGYKKKTITNIINRASSCTE